MRAEPQKASAPPSIGRLDASAIGLAVMVMAILGGSYTMVKIGLRDLPVFGSLLLRAVIASVTLGAYVRWARVPFRYRGRAARYLVAQTLAFLVSQICLYIGLTLTTAGRAAILFNTQPLMTLLVLPWFVRSDRLTARRWLGTAVAFCGVVLVLATRGTGGGSLAGDLLILVGAVAWSANTIMNKTMPSELHAASVILWNALGAIPVMALLTLLLEPGASWHFTIGATLSVLYLGAIAAGIGFVAFVWLSRTYAPSRVNVFVFLTPVFGVLIGWAALGEEMSMLQAVGGIAVAAGIFIVTSEA